MISQKIDKLKEIKNCLEFLNTSETNGVAQIRELLKNVNKALQNSICGENESTLTEINNFETAKNILLNNPNLPISETEVSIESSLSVFQIGSDNKILGTQSDTSIVNLDLLEKNPKSKTPPERGTFIQQLWKVGFIGDDGTPGGGGVGYMIVTDSSDLNFSSAFSSQHSSPLIDAPEASCEDLGTFSTDLLDKIVSARDNASNIRDVSDIMNTFSKPGLTARQLKDIDIKQDPYIKSMAISDENLTQLETNKDNKEELTKIAEELGFFVTNGSEVAIGPQPNPNYSDVKKFTLSDGKVVISSMPIICWGTECKGLPLRDVSLPANKSNRKDDGTNYICDLGGRDPVIRDGPPNPLPAHRFYGNGPFGFNAVAVKSEGALERYKGGKCLGINNTQEDATFTTIHRKNAGEINITLKPRTAMWKIERATFNLEPNSNGEVIHPYYTVFGASRPPPAGFMGVPFVPKLNLLGRGTPVIASGITAANGKSIVGDPESNPDLLFAFDDSDVKTGTALFVKQNSSGALDSDENNVNKDNLGINSELKGLNSGLAGHGMNPVDLLKWLEKNSKHFEKGTDFLTIPAKSGTQTDGSWIQPLDVLIPAGKTIPKITEAVATLWQFANGKLIPDGGPTRFQPGMVPFLPGVPAYTPQWHITFGFFNCGKAECDGSRFDVKNIAKDNTPESWHKSGAAVSLMGPPPSADSIVQGYSPSNPMNFDPHQMRCMTKGNNCPEFINSLPNTHGHDGEISVSQRIELRNTNKMYFTEAPPGAMLGWKTFLIVNCPLPMTVTYKITETNKISVPTLNLNPPEPQVDCPSCKCDRDATALFINGDEQTDAWLIDGSQANSSMKNTNNRILKFKAGDSIQIRSISGISHGVSLRFDHQTASKVPTSNLENDQKATLKEMIDNNLIELGSTVPDEGVQFIAASSDVIDEMGGIPITFPPQTNDIIADFKIGIGAKDKSGKVVCTVHGTAMKFAFEICSE